MIIYNYICIIIYIVARRFGKVVPGGGAQPERAGNANRRIRIKVPQLITRQRFRTCFFFFFFFCSSRSNRRLWSVSRAPAEGDQRTDRRRVVPPRRFYTRTENLRNRRNLRAARTYVRTHIDTSTRDTQHDVPAGTLTLPPTRDSARNDSCGERDRFFKTLNH